MPKNIVLVIQEDPWKTHRPVEALRIALGLIAGSHMTTVVLLGPAAKLLSHETEDIIDVDVLEKYLPSIQQLDMPFVLDSATNRSLIRNNFNVRYEVAETIQVCIQSADRTLVF